MLNSAGLNKVRCVTSSSPFARVTLPFPLLLLFVDLVFFIPGTNGGPFSTCEVSRLVLENVDYTPNGLLKLKKKRAPYYSCIQRDKCEDKYLEYVNPVYGGVTRVQLVDTDGNYYDAFVPIPTWCFSNNYFFFEAAYDSQNYKSSCEPFFYAVNPYDVDMTLSCFFTEDLNLVAEINVPANSATEISKELLYKDVNVKDTRIGLYFINSSYPFGIIKGARCLDPEMHEHQLVDMMPERFFFCYPPSKYVVPAVWTTEGTSVTITNLYEEIVNITLDSHAHRIDANLTDEYMMEPFSNIILPILETLIISSSNCPVMVELNMKRDNIFLPSAKTVLPPIGRWYFLFVFFAFQVKKGATIKAKHKAIIIIEKGYTNGLELTDLHTGSSLTSKLKFVDLHNIGYDIGVITTHQSRAYLLQHARRKPFQVIQYGGQHGDPPSYLLSPNTRTCQEQRLFKNGKYLGFVPVLCEGHSKGLPFKILGKNLKGNFTIGSETDPMMPYEENMEPNDLSEKSKAWVKFGSQLGADYRPQIILLFMLIGVTTVILIITLIRRKAETKSLATLA